MTRRTSQILDYVLYVAIGLGVVLAAWTSAVYDPTHYKWGYLALGTALGVGLILSTFHRERAHLRWWAVVLTLFTVETILLGFVFRTRLVDRIADDRGSNRLLVYGIGLGEAFLNGWVLHAFKPNRGGKTPV